MDLARPHAQLVALAGALQRGEPGAATEAEAVIVQLAAEAKGADRDEDSNDEFGDSRIESGSAEAGEKGIRVV